MVLSELFQFISLYSADCDALFAHCLDSCQCVLLAVFSDRPVTDKEISNSLDCDSPGTVFQFLPFFGLPIDEPEALQESKISIVSMCQTCDVLLVDVMSSVFDAICENLPQNLDMCLRKMYSVDLLLCLAGRATEDLASLRLLHHFKARVRVLFPGSSDVLDFVLDFLDESSDCFSLRSSEHIWLADFIDCFVCLFLSYLKPIFAGFHGCNI
jgi:hypothetical protein